MSGARFVRFYPSDWRSGCIGLTPEEQGFYLMVCAHFWETGERLPNDDAMASSRMMLDVRMYRRLRDKLIQKGKLHVADDGIFNPRAERELEAANRANPKGEEKADLGAARRPDDCEYPNGRNQVEGRSGSAHPLIHTSPRLPGDFLETSAQSLGEVSENSLEKVNEINASLKSHNHSKESTPLPPRGPTPLDALRAFEAYNATALQCGLPQAAKLTPDRQRKIIARLKDYGLDGWTQALANIEKSSFLTGGTDAGFRADLDFMVQAKSFGKLHDGGYGNGRHAKQAASVPAFAIPPRKRTEQEIWREEYESMKREGLV